MNFKALIVDYLAGAAVVLAMVLLHTADNLYVKLIAGTCLVIGLSVSFYYLQRNPALSKEQKRSAFIVFIPIISFLFYMLFLVKDFL